MKKEEIYINLQGKTKEELTDLWEFLTSNGEKVWRALDYFLTYEDEFLVFNKDWYGSYGIESKNEITIPQLKQILQPIDTLEQQLQKAQLEVERLKNLIEEENKIKINDWVINTQTATIFKNNTVDLGINDKLKKYKKITNPELIKLLENECSTKN